MADAETPIKSPPSGKRHLPGDRRPDTRAMIRVDQAGETGAARIYAGQLAVMGGRHAMAGEIRHMAHQEQRHLDGMNAVMARRGCFLDAPSRIGAALLASGIVGNLTDRLVQGFLLEDFKDASFWERLSQGYVVDFIAIKIPFYDKLVPSSGGWWPAFNVADSCICIAAVLLFLGGLKEDAAKKIEA